MTLKSLYNLFLSHKESEFIMKEYNAILLYRFIRKHPIKRILDLGTGIGLSATVCALALKDKGETDYHIDSVEQFDKCIKVANEIIPIELKEHITIHKSETKVWQHPKIPYQFFSNYATIPEGDYQLMINDGPSFFMLGEDFIDLPNGTITEHLDRIKPGTFIVWDGRTPALKLLERYFPDNFEVYRHNQRGDDFNILRRLDNPPIFKDDRLKEIKETTNFFKGLYEKDTFTTNGQTPSRENEALNSGASETL